MDNNCTRITYKRPRPNPLFQDWLEELHEEAKEKRSKLEPMLKKALESLSKYPLPLESGAECAILKGFKKQLCKFLDHRLEVHRRNLSLRSNADQEYQNIQIGLNSNPVQLSRSNSGLKRVTSTVTSASLGESLGMEGNSQRPVDLYTGMGTSTSNLNAPLSINNNVYQLPIDEELRRNENHSNDQSEPMSNIEYMHSNISMTDGSQTPPLTLMKNFVPFKPLPRSSAYAVLITLLEQSKANPNKPYLSKEELVRKGQKHCDEPFVHFKDDMRNLEVRGLVLKNYHRRTVYSLTDDGLDLAKELIRVYRVHSTIHTVTSLRFEGVSTILPFSGEIDNIDWTPEIIEMPAGSYDIILLIDKNEVRGGSRRNESIVDIFKRCPDFKHEYRNLKVGDFIWIARYKDNNDKELVLPYIVERKRMDDLAYSIKDGRFHEQKFRLRKSRIKNVIYLAENYGTNVHLGLPMPTLEQALNNTRVQDEFRVHITNSLADTANFLTMMTKRLIIRFQDKNLRGSNYDTKEEDFMSFNYFNRSTSKTRPLTVTETFIKMLLQLRGVSVEKAIAITFKYKTPRNLMEAYRKCDDNDCKFLLAHINYGESNQTIGPVVSYKIYLLFTKTSNPV